MADVADVSRDVDAGAAALRALPPLPEPNRWEQRSEACCGATLVLTLCGGFVAATRHMSSKIADHEVLRDIFVGAIHTEALVALICLLGLMWADPGVVHRSSGSSLPVPLQVKQVLEVGQSVVALQNVVEGTDVYCVRCCVWRRKNSGHSSPLFCDDGLMDNFHHCSTCQRLVANFDHHCGVFGRCIAGRGFGGNMGFFKVLIAMALAGAVTCFASVVMVLIKQEEGSLLAVVLLAYITPMLLGCCILLCSMLWPEEGCRDGCHCQHCGRCGQCGVSYARVLQDESPRVIGAGVEMRDAKVA